MSGAPYYVQIVGPAGRVTYLEELAVGDYHEVEDHLLATPYHTDDEASNVCEHVAYGHFAGQRVLLTVCSSDEFEGD